jgi:hypothetical protein
LARRCPASRNYPLLPRPRRSGTDGTAVPVRLLAHLKRAPRLLCVPSEMAICPAKCIEVPQGFVRFKNNDGEVHGTATSQA